MHVLSVLVFILSHDGIFHVLAVLMDHVELCELVFVKRIILLFEIGYF